MKADPNHQQALKNGDKLYKPVNGGCKKHPDGFRYTSDRSCWDCRSELGKKKLYDRPLGENPVIYKHWTPSAIDCYNLQANCSICPIVTHTKCDSLKYGLCNMKNVVPVLLEKLGPPPEKQRKTGSGGPRDGAGRPKKTPLSVGG